MYWLLFVIVWLSHTSHSVLQWFPSVAVRVPRYVAVLSCSLYSQPGLCSSHSFAPSGILSTIVMVLARYSPLPVLAPCGGMLWAHILYCILVSPGVLFMFSLAASNDSLL